MRRGTTASGAAGAAGTHAQIQTYVSTSTRGKYKRQQRTASQQPQPLHVGSPIGPITLEHKHTAPICFTAHVTLHYAMQTCGGVEAQPHHSSPRKQTEVSFQLHVSAALPTVKEAGWGPDAV